MASEPASRFVDWGRSLLWLHLLLVCVLFSSRTTEAFELPKVALSVAVALALVGAAVVAGIAGGGRIALRSLVGEPIALGVVLTLLAAGASTVCSISPRVSILGAQGSFSGLATLASYATLFFAARALCSTPAAVRSVLSGAALGLGVAVVYGFAQVAGLDPVRWEAQVVFAGVPRVFSTMGHPNSLAQVLAVGLPVLVCLLLDALHHRRVAALALGLVAAGAVVLMPFTMSRAGCLAMAAAIPVWAVAGRRGVVVGVCLSGVLGLALAFGLFHGVEGTTTLGERLTSLGQDPRRFLWAGAWEMFLDHPWLGVGPDCFSLAYGRYRSAAAWSAEWAQTPLKAHCQPLDILATGGLAGAAAVLPMIVGVSRGLARARRRQGDDPWLGAAACAGLLAFGVHILFHFPTAAGTSLALVLAAIVSRQADPDAAAPPAPAASIGVRVGSAVLGLLLVDLFVLRPLRADVVCRAGTVSTLADPERATAYGREAVRLDPSRDLLWLRLSAAYQAAGRSARDPALRSMSLGDARRAALTAVRLVPVNAYGWAHLGTLLSDLEREEPPLSTRADVEAAFERARALDPNNCDILVAAATAALAARDLERAERWSGLASRLYPTAARPRALLGAVRLARQQRAEAIVLLREALAGDWRGDEQGRSAADANLQAALRLPGTIQERDAVNEDGEHP